jgi:hypothetical protein
LNPSTGPGDLDDTAGDFGQQPGERIAAVVGLGGHAHDL